MIRGTTPTLQFTLPFEVSMIEQFYITINQNKRTILEKKPTDCEVSGNLIVCKLTQADTLRFDDAKNIEIQIRCKLIDGSALASNIIECSVNRILKEGEI